MKDGSRRNASISVTKVTTKRKINKLLWSSLAIGAFGACWVVNRYYEQEPFQYLNLISKPSLLKQLMIKIHILPKSLPDVS